MDKNFYGERAWALLTPQTVSRLGYPRRSLSYPRGVFSSLGRVVLGWLEADGNLAAGQRGEEADMRDSQHGFRVGQPNWLWLLTALIPAPRQVSSQSDWIPLGWGWSPYSRHRGPWHIHPRHPVCLSVRDSRLRPASAHGTVSRGGTAIIWRWAHRAARLN